MQREIPAQGSYLASIDLYRLADGSIEARLTDMPPRLIETTGNEVNDRLRIVAGWTRAGADNLLMQATRFDQPANDGTQP